MRTHLRFLVLFAVLGAASFASAQDAPPDQVFVDAEGEEGYVEEEYVEDGSYTQDQYAQPGYQDPTYQGEVAGEPYQQQEPERLGRQVSIALDVPLFLTNTQDVGAGIGAHLRFGWEFGMLVPQVKLGVATNFLENDTIGGAGERIGSDNINSLWATLGVRLQILNRTRFVPVIDAGLRLQFWSYPYYGGAYADDYVFEPGISVSAGLAIELTARVGLEIGVDANAIFPTSDTFLGYPSDGTQFFLTPHIGGTVYF